MYNSQEELVINQPKEATKQQPTPVFDFTATINAALTQAVHLTVAPLMARIELLERSLVVADKAAQGNESDLSSRLALLEDKMDNITTASDERIKEIAEEVAEGKMTEHTDEYDHYEIECQIERMDDKIDDKVTEAIDDYDFADKMRDIMRHASVSIDI
jgi:hypothetical protein